ncbi:MAG: hypothetical protein CMF74_11395 [Maricaulis sp.]|jgi:hypothetical protein|nr:hypothetical protein [Maricaulis sp.]HAQ36428.1 DUF1178 domain-containing protein [Alphaproteobacteria bacterium]|tara:strand:+ start:120 stop:542 length:423 start_codon:yes stop_codon:yes gene_type:complete
MIRYALICDGEHEFEAWFRNSSDFDEQAEAGLVECPLCASTAVKKAVMAPNIASPKRRKDSPQAMMMEVAGKVRSHIRDNFDYVGNKFADEARAMHDGDTPHRDIYGETTPEQAKALAEDGVPCSPLPAPFAPVPPKLVN